MSEREKIEAVARVSYAGHMEGVRDATPWGALPAHVREQFRNGARALLSCALAAPAEREDEVERARDAMCEAILEYRRRQRDPMDFSAGACWNTVLNAIEDYASAAESARRGGKGGA